MSNKRQAESEKAVRELSLLKARAVGLTKGQREALDLAVSVLSARALDADSEEG